MRYDNDAKLIYIGKKHINLTTRHTLDSKSETSISPIFELLLRVICLHKQLQERGELDKDKLSEKLRMQRFGDKEKDKEKDKDRKKYHSQYFYIKYIFSSPSSSSSKSS